MAMLNRPLGKPSLKEEDISNERRNSLLMTFGVIDQTKLECWWHTEPVFDPLPLSDRSKVSCDNSTKCHSLLECRRRVNSSIELRYLFAL